MNNTTINTYEIKTLTLNFHLKRSFTWQFHTAWIAVPILGADFLKSTGLIVDVSRKKLIDPSSDAFFVDSVGCLRLAGKSTVSVMDHSSPISSILSDFPEVTGLKPYPPITAIDIFHHIKTHGPLVAERTRRLDPEKLKVAQVEFERLVIDCVCKYSKSSWATPIHLARKKDGTWKVYGDNRCLNANTVPDRYTILYLHDFSYNLAEKRVFSKLDLHRAYNQIPIAPANVLKTSVTTGRDPL